MNIYKLVAIILCFGLGMLLLNSCGQRYTHSDFVGKWVSADGAKLEFNKKNFKAFNLRKNAVFGTTLKDKLVSASGEWAVEDNQLDIDFNAVDNAKELVRINMNTSGRGNSMCISFTVGDPDDVNFYEFYRPK